MINKMTFIRFEKITMEINSSNSKVSIFRKTNNRIRLLNMISTNKLYLKSFRYNISTWYDCVINNKTSQRKESNILSLKKGINKINRKQGTKRRLRFRKLENHNWFILAGVLLNSFKRKALFPKDRKSRIKFNQINTST
jgi:hypothetical protein